MDARCCCLHSYAQHTAHSSQSVKVKAPHQGWLAAAKAVGFLAVVVIGAIGIVGVLHTHGIIPSFPHSFSWIEKIGTFGHGVIIGGVGLGVVVIVIGCIKSYCDKQAEKERIEVKSELIFLLGKMENLLE